MVGGGRREKGSGWGTHVYLWQIHFDIWQNQYNIVKLKNKIKFKKKKKEEDHYTVRNIPGVLAGCVLYVSSSGVSLTCMLTAHLSMAGFPMSTLTCAVSFISSRL